MKLKLISDSLLLTRKKIFSGECWLCRVKRDLLLVFLGNWQFFKNKPKKYQQNVVHLHRSADPSKGEQEVTREADVKEKSGIRCVINTQSNKITSANPLCANLLSKALSSRFQVQ